jgi:predicted dehydrogenase
VGLDRFRFLQTARIDRGACPTRFDASLGRRAFWTHQAGPASSTKLLEEETTMTSTTRPLRVGLIGASPQGGWGAESHLPAIEALPETELLAICTAHEDTARAASEKYGVERAYYDHKRLVNDPDLDAVAVVIRVPVHYQVTMDAINAGKHVYTEWPLTLTSAEAQELADAADAKGVKTRVGFQRRASPPHMRLKELVAEGFVGEVLSVHFNMQGSGILENTSARSWRRDKRFGTNTMTVSFGHEIDAVLNAVGEVTEVSGRLSTQVTRWYETDTGQYVDVTSPDNIIMEGRLENGGVVTAHVGVQPFLGSGYRLEIYGREGTLVMLPRGGGDFQILGGRKDDRALQEQPIPERLTWVPEGLSRGAFNVGQMWFKFAESIRTGERIEPDFKTAVSRHKLLEAIERASETGQRQRLD